MWLVVREKGNANFVCLVVVLIINKGGINKHANYLFIIFTRMSKYDLAEYDRALSELTDTFMDVQLEREALQEAYREGRISLEDMNDSLYILNLSE